jgi:hypothetical protein
MPDGAPDSDTGLTEEEKTFDTNEDNKLDEQEQAAYDAAHSQGAGGDSGTAPSGSDDGGGVAAPAPA